MKQFVTAAFPEDGTLEISGKDFHYLAEVRRESEGAVLPVRIPDGTLLSFRIEKINRTAKTAVLRMVQDGSDAASGNPAPDGGSAPAADFPKITLFQWILKTNAMDLVVRQAVETGVSAVVPVAGAHCVSTLRAGAENPRWTRIVRSALQQSGSPVPTRILPAVTPAAVPGVLAELCAAKPLALMLSEIPGGGKTVHECLASHYARNAAADSGRDTAARGAFPQPASAVHIALAVGPEGGMTAKEAEILTGGGFEKIHFCTNVLRAETAALYGLAAVQTSFMEMSKWQLKG